MPCWLPSRLPVPHGPNKYNPRFLTGPSGPLYFYPIAT